MDVDAWFRLRESIESMRSADDHAPVFVRLRATGATLELRNDVPATRAACPTTRPCPHVHCRHHLWTVIGGPDGTRAGRPGLSSIPRDRRGLTRRVVGPLGNEERPGTTLEPRWLEKRLAASCALDEASRPLGNAEIGKRLGRHRTLVATEVERAVARLREAGVDLGALLEVTSK